MSGEPWLRLDPRMLLVHPIDELRKFIVPLVATAVFGATQGGGAITAAAAFAIPIGLGIVRYLTTSYRITEGRVELRRGLLNRQLLSTATDRVRTVDITASLIHRTVGLTTVTIGTGGTANGAGDALKLDGLTVDEGRALRGVLLAEQSATAEPTAAAPPIARFEPAWLRFAPFTSAGLAILGGLVGGGLQVLSELDIQVDVLAEDVAGRTTAVLVAGVIGIGALVLLLTVLGYLVANWQFTLRRDAETWHVSRGLLTTREISIDVDRMAGVSVAEPPGLRLARGSRLTAIVTGLGGSQRGSRVLVPPAPDRVVRGAGSAVLGSDQPLTAPLTRHGAAAVRRRWVRALVPAAAVAVVPAAFVVAGLPAWVLVVPAAVLAVAVGLAVDRVRSLGHVVVADYLVARSGSLQRQREALAVDHVIGWTFRDTWFQRRAGLTTLDATTAGGRGRVTVLDVPVNAATDLARSTTPDLVGQFSRARSTA